MKRAHIESQTATTGWKSASATARRPRRWRWSLRTRQWTGWTLTSLGGAGEAADFYLPPSNLSSSQYPVYEPGKLVKGEWKKTAVSRIDLEATWRIYFGDLRCHLLKVDIEGSEGSLLKAETEFVRRVDVLVLEWHKWIVSRESIEESLRSQGFALVEVLQENETTGIVWYKRRQQ